MTCFGRERKERIFPMSFLVGQIQPVISYKSFLKEQEAEEKMQSLNGTQPT